MMEKIKGLSGLFEKRFMKGISMRGGEEGIVIIVAQDGSGDFDNIKEAVDELKQAKGGKIIIKEGDYNISLKINLETENSIIEGQGEGTNLIGAAGIGAVFELNNNKIRVKNMKFTVGGTSVFTNAGIRTHTVVCNDCEISNCYFTGVVATSSHGIYLLYSGENTKILNNTFDGLTRGITMQGASGSVVIGNLFKLNVSNYDIVKKEVVEIGHNSEI